MTSAITAFRRRHPDVTLEFRSAYSSRRCIELLHDGQTDLAWITLGAFLVFASGSGRRRGS